jgi:hypothetical protein
MYESSHDPDGNGCDCLARSTEGGTEANLEDIHKSGRVEYSIPKELDDWELPFLFRPGGRKRFRDI